MIVAKNILIGLIVIANFAHKNCALTHFGRVQFRARYPNTLVLEQDYEKAVERDLDSDEVLLVNTTEVAPVSVTEPGPKEYKCYHDEWNHKVDDTRCFLHEVTSLNFTISDANVRKILFLKFKNSSINTIPTQIFDYFPQLRDLVIDNANIQSIDSESFKNDSSLVYLILSENKLKSIMDNTFIKLQKLSILDLKHNEIQSVNKDAFLGLNELRMLSLDYNKIKVINSRMLSPLKSLVTIGMKQNQLQTLPEGLFKNCQGVKFLDFSYNQIDSLPASLFNDLNSYTYLNFDENVCVNGEFIKVNIFEKDSLYDSCMIDVDKKKLNENFEGIRERVENIERTIARLDAAISVEGSKKLSDAVADFDKKLTEKSDYLTRENNRKINEEVMRLENKMKRTNEKTNEMLKSSIDKTAEEIIQNTVNELKQQAKDQYSTINVKIYIAFFSLLLAAIALGLVYYKLRTPLPKVGDREQIL
jgi:hypothetical protein